MATTAKYGKNRLLGGSWRLKRNECVPARPIWLTWNADTRHVSVPEGARSAEGIMRRRDLIKLAGAAVLPARFAIARSAGVQTLRFVPQNNLSVLDPIFTTASGTTNHGWAIYDTLFGVNSRQEVKPQMAAGFTRSDDGRTYLIRLRDGLNFHNGEPVRAQDCAPSLARWAARTSLGQEMAKFVDSWGVQDDRTVKITLKQPLPIFIWALAKDSGIIPFMMPEHMARTDPFKQITETIGSGPYLFAKDEFVSGSSATYVRNTAYVPRPEPADWTSGGKVTHFDRIEWKVIPDSATAAAALQTGRWIGMNKCRQIWCHC
jgi:peptide/nickel transport system substrate-binding protein